MLVRLLPMRVRLAALACVFALACDTPDGPTKATKEQVDQMNLDFSGGSTGFATAADWPAIIQAIRSAKDSADRQHWMGEFIHHAAALPESLRTQRLAELRQLRREVR